MLKKTLILVLLASLLLPAAAMAEVTNRDMQLLGGVVVSNSTDSFFFAPMEEGLTKHWGLYALSKASEGPIVEIQEGYPARLVHADDQKVYFLGYTDANRSVHSLYSVTISGGQYEELVTNIKSAFVGESDMMLYITTDNEYALRSYDIKNAKDALVKDMSKSDKTIYDAGIYDGVTYFITKTSNGSEDAYQYHESSGKATNLEKLSPAASTGFLYEGYRIYQGVGTDETGTQIYAQKIDVKQGERIGANFNVSLTSPRFGQSLYVYNGDNHQLVGLPLDGSSAKTITLEGSTMARLVLGGSKDELLLINNEAVYGLTSDLSSQTKLFDFNTATGAQVWSYVAPAGSNAIMIMGYGAETFTLAGNLMPTGVYAFDRATGDMLFGFPSWDADSAVLPATSETGENLERPPTVVPETIGEAPVEEKEEGETYFIF